MRCVKCGGKSTVKDVVCNNDTKETYRRHVCRECDYSFYTVQFEVEPSARFEHIFKKLRSERVLSYYNKKNKE